MDSRQDWLRALQSYVDPVGVLGLQERRVLAARLDGAWHGLRLGDTVLAELEAANCRLPPEHRLGFRSDVLQVAIGVGR